MSDLISDPGVLTSMTALIAQGAQLAAQLLSIPKRRRREAVEDALDEYKEFLRRRDHSTLLRELEQHGLVLQAIAKVICRTQVRPGQDLEELQSRIEREIKSVWLAAATVGDWLSKLPLTTRPRRELPLIGREEELNWLATETTHDCVVAGQPGSGKSYLLERFIADRNGFFLVGHDSIVPATVLTSTRPEVVVLDDAGDSQATVRRLRHIRDEAHLAYRIVAICWPSEVEPVSSWLARPISDALVLRPLTRDEIVQVLKAAGFDGPVDWVRILVDQSENKPGLAVTLADLAVTQAGREILDGRALAAEVRRWMEPRVGEESAHALAAFGFGGDAGLPRSAVASHLGIDELSLSGLLRQLAAAGVLTETARGTLSVRPEALRYRLVADYFFTDAMSSDPNPLLAELAPPDEQTLLLIEVKRYGGVVGDRLLQPRLERASTGVWERYAWLGEAEASVALKSRPELALALAQPLLHNVPEQAIYQILAIATGGSQAGETATSATLDRIRRWIVSGPLDDAGATRRRRALLDAVLRWLQDGGNPTIATSLFCVAFEPVFDYGHTDPGRGRTYTIQRGTLNPNQLSEIGGWWRDGFAALKRFDMPCWSPFLKLISDWGMPDQHLHMIKQDEKGRAFCDAVRAATRVVAKEMLADVAEATMDHPAVQHLLSRQDADLTHGIEFRLDPVFETLWVERSFGAEREQRESEHRSRVIALAEDWGRQDPSVVAQQMRRLESYANDVRLYDERWMPILCAHIASVVDDVEPWISALLNKSPSADTVSPFVRRAVATGHPQLERILHEAMSAPQIEAEAIRIALEIETPPERILCRVLERLEAIGERVDLDWLFYKIPVANARKLLEHPAKRVAASAAKAEWLFDETHTIRGELESAWKHAVVRALEDDYILSEVFQRYPEMARDWTKARITDERFEFYRYRQALPILGRVLSAGKRVDLLKLVPPRSYHRSDLIRCLVGADPNVYSAFLDSGGDGRPNLDPLHRPSMSGETFDEQAWLRMAAVALDHGAEPAAVAFAGLWPGGVFRQGTDVWESRKAWYHKLTEHEDERLHEVGRLGISMAEEELRRVLAEEREEELRGI